MLWGSEERPQSPAAGDIERTIRRRWHWRWGRSGCRCNIRISKYAYFQNTGPVVYSVPIYCNLNISCSYIWKFVPLKPVSSTALVPEKTSVNDLPSFETPITNLLILSVPLYHETSKLHTVFFFPISNVRDDPRPCSDHRVAGSSSIAYFGPRLGVPPASVIFETDSLLQGLEVGGDGNGGVVPTEVTNDHVLPAVIALPALSFTPVVMVTV